MQKSRLFCFSFGAVSALLVTVMSTLSCFNVFAEGGEVQEIVVEAESIPLEEMKEYKIGWLIGYSYIRSEPSALSEPLERLPVLTQVSYTDYDEEWVECNGGYLSRSYISDVQPITRSVVVNQERNFKSFMSYETITDKSSRQYELQNYAEDSDIGIRTVEGRYCVAVGTATGCSIGDYIDLELSNGTVIECIVGDIKSDQHTESNNIITAFNGCCSEFIVNTRVMPSNVKGHGNYSRLCDEWNATVASITVLPYNYFWQLGY